MTIEELLALRKQIEERLEAADKQLLKVVAERLEKGNDLRSAVPGGDYYYLTQGVVTLQEAWRSVERQIAMNYHRKSHPEMPYGITLRERS